MSDDFDFRAIARHLTPRNAIMLLLVIVAWALGIILVLYVAAAAWRNS